VCLGDSEELWENTLSKVKDSYPQTFEAEKKFIAREAFYKILGNHDLYWGNDPFAWWQLEKIYGVKLKVYEAVILSVSLDNRPFRIFCTHGHQGDAQSDGNWFSKFFVARIWAPFQAYLRINPNTAAYNNEKKTLHNEIMYEWSAVQKDTLLITGHTHQPVFVSLTHIERLYREFQFAKHNDDTLSMQKIEAEIRKREREFAAVAVDYLTMKPSYFNSGCCCFIDGDITGIEIENGQIRLVKWTKPGELSERKVLEEISLAELAKSL
jgi:UDP-2,3-diacylglucosamine pyrophosphatase LpxH